MPAWIAAATGIAVALIAAVVTGRQSRANRRLEREKIELAHRLDERTEARKETADQARAAEAKAAEVEDRLKREEAAADEQGRQAIEYRRKVIGRLRDLKILDMSRSLDLDRLYVQLRVKEEEPLRFVSDEAIAELASGEPEKMLRLSREHLRNRSAESLAPEAALARFRRIVVLGDPGAGKTTMLRYLAFRGAREELDGITFPVYVELREFIDSGETDLLAYAAADMDRRYGFSGAGSYIEERLRGGDAVLLLDGLDEVLGGENAEAATEAYQRVASETARLATRYPDLTIAVTCRKAGWRGGLPQFQTLEVLDFDWPEIQEFIGNWFTGDPGKADGLRGALERNLRMQTLAANPLLLSLIALVYERDLELPERRARLYERCVEVMLKDWDAHRDIRRFSQFTADRKRDLLEEIAWHFHGAGLRYFPKDDLLGIVREFLPTIDIGSEHAETILKEIVAQYGLLKEQAQGWYGFLHLTLQEYFTAQAADERGAAAIARVVSARHDPWWEEVILLLAGRLSDASGLILGILGRDPAAAEPDPGEDLAVDDDLFRGDLLLAGRCLASQPRLRASWLRERLLRETWRILRTSPHWELRNSAARVVAEAGGPGSRAELLTLIADSGTDEEQRRAAADALGAVGGAEVASGLLGLLEWLEGTPDARTDVIRVLGEMRCKDAIPSLLRILRSSVSQEEDTFSSGQRDGYRCCSALAKIGDGAVKQELWRMLDHLISQGDSRGFELWGYYLPRAISDLGDSSDVDRLLKIVGDENSYFHSARLTAVALLNSPISGMTDEILRIIADPRVDARVREAVVPLLAADEDGCRPQLQRCFHDANIASEVKTAVAEVLAGWGDAEGFDYLRAAGNGKDIEAQNAAFALAQLSDSQTLPRLAEEYVRNATGVLQHYAIKKADLPVFWAPLESGAIPATDAVLPQKIGEVADTPEDAGRLARMYLALDEHDRHEADALFSAIRRVSRRARVRVFGDGRVVPVSG